MQIIKNKVIDGSAGLNISLDIFYKAATGKKPVIIYAHGFNGFKDWGNFDLIAMQFADAGFVCVKFNFSHNGTSVRHPEEFVNLEAFGNNNYTKQLEDLKRVIDWVIEPANEHAAAIDPANLYLVGHSMGGGISILYASEDKRINKLSTWAAISECKTPWGNWSPEKIRDWQTAGVEFYNNSRTQQQMPLYYQLYEDFQEHAARLDIKKAIASLKIPLLICHGTLDTSVSLDKAEELLAAQPDATLFTVESDHVFGRKHPWPGKELPAPMQAVVNRTISFFNGE